METYPVTSSANVTGFTLLSCAASLLIGGVVWKNKSGEGTADDVSWTVIVAAILLAVVGNSILFVFD